MDYYIVAGFPSEKNRGYFFIRKWQHFGTFSNMPFDFNFCRPGTNRTPLANRKKTRFLLFFPKTLFFRENRFKTVKNGSIRVKLTVAGISNFQKSQIF